MISWAHHKMGCSSPYLLFQPHSFIPRKIRSSLDFLYEFCLFSNSPLALLFHDFWLKDSGYCAFSDLEPLH